jgi:hypothetical protein
MAPQHAFELNRRACSLDPHRSGRSSDAAPARGDRLVLILLFGTIVVAAFFAALDIASRLAQTSDSAQGFVQGHAIARGNILLSGWHLPLDNYYFTDTIAYAAMEWILGPQPFLLALVPAITYALFVCTGLAVCVKPVQSAARNTEAAAAAALMLAPSGWIGSWNPLLMSDMHFATVLGAIVALALCARIAQTEEKGPGLFASSAFFVLITTATIASDPFSLVFAFGPALVLISADAVQGPKRNGRIALLALAGAMVLGALWPFLIARVGGFATDNHVVTAFVSPALLGRNASAIAGSLLRLSGADPLAMSLSWLGLVLLALRWLWLAVVVAAILHAIRALFRSVSLFERLLCAGILSVLTACVLSTQFDKGIGGQSPWAGGPPMRYVMPAVMFGAILGARRVPEMLSALSGARVRAVARGALVALAMLAFCAGALEAPGDQPRWIAHNPPAVAALWLAQRGLTTGDADYWSANIVAVMSRETLDLRSVVPEDGKVVPYTLSADARKHGASPQFMIWQDGTRSGMTFDDIRATYPVCTVASVAGYRIALLARPGYQHVCTLNGAKRVRG